MFCWSHHDVSLITHTLLQAVVHIGVRPHANYCEPNADDIDLFGLPFDYQSDNQTTEPHISHIFILSYNCDIQGSSVGWSKTVLDQSGDPSSSLSCVFLAQQVPCTSEETFKNITQ